MLHEILSIIQHDGPNISRADLCQRLEISPDYLQSMIDILIRKGRLKPDEAPTCGGNNCCSQKSCPSPDECELVLIKPITEIRFTPGLDE
jgi:hypothetical protein